MATCAPVYKAYTVARSAWGDCYESGTSYYRWGEPTSLYQRTFTQSLLKNKGFYSGPADGAWGPNTIKGIMRALADKNQYSGPIDGIPGRNTLTGVGNFACDWFGSTEDDYWEWDTRHTLCDVAQIPADGAGDRFWELFTSRLSYGV